MRHSNLFEKFKTMKTKYIFISILSALVWLTACSSETSVIQTAETQNVEQAIENNQEIQNTEEIQTEESAWNSEIVSLEPVTNIIARWTFTTVEENTSGTVEFIQTNDVTTITLSNFKTSSAPDLGIYLSKQESISNKVDISNAIKLVSLESSSWDQSYIVAADIDLSEYNSVAIHCTQYNKLFGSASMK